MSLSSILEKLSIVSSEPDQQISLQFSRGVLVFAAVVLTVAWFGAGGKRMRDQAGHAFGFWEKPDIVPILEDTARSETLGIRVDAVEGYSFFFVDHPGDGVGPATISMINRKDAILGAIKAYDPLSDQWPPQADDFGYSVSIKEMAGSSPGEPELGVGPPDDFQLQVQTILYGETKVTWASPRKSPAWPLRMHLGKCEIGDRTVLLSIYEVHAKSPEPDYEQGPIAEIASALSPL